MAVAKTLASSEGVCFVDRCSYTASEVSNRKTLPTAAWEPTPIPVSSVVLTTPVLPLVNEGFNRLGEGMPCRIVLGVDDEL